MPAHFPSTSSHSPVCTPARTSMPSPRTRSWMSRAQWIARAGPSQVLVSQTVKELVAGSGFTFTDAGEHQLKGIPQSYHLYAAG
jgi:hypothetical protein